MGREEHVCGGGHAQGREEEEGLRELHWECCSRLSRVEVFGGRVNNTLTGCHSQWSQVLQGVGEDDGEGNRGLEAEGEECDRNHSQVWCGEYSS